VRGRQYVPCQVRLCRVRRRNAPDPSKRYQIDQKLVWAEQQLQYAQREKLVAEERQMKQLIADCNLIKEEMDLIEAVRKDAAQTVSIEHASPR